MTGYRKLSSETSVLGNGRFLYAGLLPRLPAGPEVRGESARLRRIWLLCCLSYLGLSVLRAAGGQDDYISQGDI